MKPKYSIILLEYDPDNKLAAMRAECRQLIEENSQGNYEIIPVAMKGLCKALNYGFSQAKGNYFFLVASDIMIHDTQWLEKMSIPHTVVSWFERTFSLTGEPELEMSFFGVPRNVWEKAGEWDEIFDKGYGFDDDDWLRRVRMNGFKTKIVPVMATHLESKTFKSYYSEEEFFEKRMRNQEIFQQRWPKSL